MDALLAIFPWETVGPSAILFLAVLLIIRGDLVPRRTHESIVREQREALRIERQSNAEIRQALRILATEHGTTTDKLLSALPVPQDEGEV